MDKIKLLEDKIVIYKYAGVLRRKGVDVLDFVSLSDDPQTVKVKDRSNIYLKYERIVKVRIEEVEEV
jgi:hypothetical protein